MDAEKAQMTTTGDPQSTRRTSTLEGCHVEQHGLVKTIRCALGTDGLESNDGGERLVMQQVEDGKV